MDFTGETIAKCICDSDLRVVSANQNFYDLVGYNEEDFQKDFNNRLLAIIPEDDGALLCKDIASAAEVSTVFRLIQSNGKLRTVIGVCKHDYYAINKECLVFTLYNITPEEKVDDSILKLQQLTDQFHTMINNAPVGIALFRLEEIIKALYTNNMFYELFGFSRVTHEYAVLKDGCALVHPEDAQGLIAELFAASFEGRSARFFCRCSPFSDRLRWVLIEGKQVDIQDGYPIFLLVLSDQTEQKLLEQELRINNNRLNLAVSQLAVTIWEVDHSSLTLRVWNKIKEAFDEKHTIVNVPQYYLDNQVIAEDSLAEFCRFYDDMYKGELSGSCIIRKKYHHGEYRWLRLSFRNCFDSNGKAYKAVGITEEMANS